MNRHLNHKLYERLLSGRLSKKQEGRLLAHLRQDCDECENFMAGLDAEQVLVLMDIVERTSSPRVPEKMRDLPSRSKSIFRTNSIMQPALGFVILALIVLSVVLVRQSPVEESNTSRLKGTGTLSPAPSISLSVGRVLSKASGTAQIDRVGKNASVSPDQRLIFSMDIEGCCYPYLAFIYGSSVEILYPVHGPESLCHDAGTFVPEIDGRPAAMSLEGYDGKIRFVAACTDKPLSNPREDLMLVVSGTGLSKGRFESIDTVDVFVSSKAGEP